MTPNKKIAIIDASEYTTGARSSIVEYVKSLSDNFEFYLLFSHTENLELKKHNNINLIEFKFKKLKKSLVSLLFYPFYLIKEVFRIHKIAKKNSIKIFHLNDLYYLHGILLRILGYKIIYHIRLLPSSYIGKLYDFYLYLIKKCAHEVLVVSHYLKTYFNDNAIVIYDRMPFEECYPPYQCSSNSHEEIRILVVGNYVEGKGHSHALNVFKTAKDLGFRGSINFVGDDSSQQRLEYKNSLETHSKEKGIKEYVSFNSSCSDMEQLYKKYDLLLNLSESESFSMVNFEAMYYGLPVISANSEGPKEQIINNTTGYLVNYNDYNKIAKLLISLQVNGKLKFLSKECKKHIRRKFAGNEYLNKLKSVYLSFS